MKTRVLDMSQKYTEIKRKSSQRLQIYFHQKMASKPCSAVYTGLVLESTISNPAGASLTGFRN